MSQNCQERRGGQWPKQFKFLAIDVSSSRHEVVFCAMNDPFLPNA